MIALEITKAAPTVKAPEDLVIYFSGCPPDDMDLIEASVLYNREAAQLAEALWSTLPGGTLDRLIGKLFEHRASLFAIPHYRPKEEHSERGTTAPARNALVLP